MDASRYSQPQLPPLSFVAAAGLASLLLCCNSARASLLGVHEVSDTVKTAGWACDPDRDESVRVHLYAETPNGLVLLDSQWADQHRSDLQSVCGSAGRAFRFANYAARSVGAALYATSDPIPMVVHADTPSGPVAITGTPRSVSFAAVGLWDPGLKNGRWRTDFDDPAEGTVAAPLLLGKCEFTTPVADGYHAFSGGGLDPVTGCRYGSTVSPRSNAKSSDGSWPTASFWTIVANVEDALLNPACTNGPPGQSLPVGMPGSGDVFGVVALPDFEGGSADRLKMHMVLNSREWTACRTLSYGGPYLSISAQADRGNNGTLTYLNMPGAPSTLHFGLTLMDIAGPPDNDPSVPAGAEHYSQSHVLIEAMWGGVKRWLFIELIPDGRRVSGTDEGWVDVHVRFNWHMHNSMIYPGADYLFKSANLLSAQCAGEKIVVPTMDRAATYVNPATREQSRREYSIDLQRLFECLERRGEWGASPMPSHPIPITGISFGLEQDDRLYVDGQFSGVVAPNFLWVAVDDVRLEMGK